MHQGMELPPAVVVGVEEEGFGEEEQDVREEGGREHAHQVVRELRIQDDEHERQERAEGRGEREGDREELRELVREPVVSQISGLVADRLDDEREDRDGQDERREQQVELRDHPDGHAAPDERKRPVLRLLVGLVLGLGLRGGRLGGLSRGAGRLRRRSRQGPGKASLYSSAHQRRGHLDRRRRTSRGRRRDREGSAVCGSSRRSCTFITVPPSLDLPPRGGASAALASRLRSSSRT